MSDVEAYFDEVEKRLASIWGWSDATRSGRGRQILLVERVTFVSSNYVERTGASPDSLGYLVLDGTNSASSDVTSGVIRFVEASAIKKPEYSAAEARIFLWVNIKNLELTLAQTEHRSLYLWVNEFANGHIYGDLHSLA